MVTEKASPAAALKVFTFLKAPWKKYPPKAPWHFSLPDRCSSALRLQPGRNRAEGAGYSEVPLGKFYGSAPDTRPKP